MWGLIKLLVPMWGVCRFRGRRHKKEGYGIGCVQVSQGKEGMCMLWKGQEVYIQAPFLPPTPPQVT